MDKWINEETLQHLMFEVKQHKKNSPRSLPELAAYREMESELCARLKLHMEVLKPKRRKIW